VIYTGALCVVNYKNHAQSALLLLFNHFLYPCSILNIILQYYKVIKAKTMNKPQESKTYYFEQLFGSKTRVKLLRLFLIPGRPIHYFVREICRLTSEHLNSVRREIDNLEKLGLIIKEEDDAGAKQQKVFYKVDKSFILYNELKALFMKSQLLLEKTLVTKLKDIANIQLLILTGAFTGNTEATTDLLIVGRIKTVKLSSLIKQFEKELGHEINYTLLSGSEFNYRRELTDMFLYNILENKKVVLIDNLDLNKKELKKDYARKKINVKKVK